MEKMGATAHRHGVVFGGGRTKMFPNVTVIIVVQPWKYAKNTELYTLKE